MRLTPVSPATWQLLVRAQVRALVLVLAPAQHAVMHTVDPARLESQSRTSTAGTLQKTQFLNCHVQKEAISN